MTLCTVHDGEGDSKSEQQGICALSTGEPQCNVPTCTHIQHRHWPITMMRRIDDHSKREREQASQRFQVTMSVRPMLA